MDNTRPRVLLPDNRRHVHLITRHLLSLVSPHQVRLTALPLLHFAGILFARINTIVATSRQPAHLPPIQPGDSNYEQYYPNSATAHLNAVFGREAKSPRNTRPLHAAGTADMPRGPVPRFKKLDSVQDLLPRINPQPAFRRANPEGGFISVSPALGGILEPD